MADRGRNLLHLRAPPTVAPPRGFAIIAGVLLGCGLLLGRRRRRFPTRHLLACLVAYRDQQRGYVLAVLPGLLKRRAGAVRSDALTTEANRDLVRVGIRTFDSPLSVRVVQVDFVDHFSLLVIEPAQKGASSEQPSKSAVGECRKGVS